MVKVLRYFWSKSKIKRKRRALTWPNAWVLFVDRPILPCAYILLMPCLRTLSNCNISSANQTIDHKEGTIYNFCPRFKLKFTCALKKKSALNIKHIWIYHMDSKHIAAWFEKDKNRGRTVYSRIGAAAVRNEDKKGFHVKGVVSQNIWIQSCVAHNDADGNVVNVIKATFQWYCSDLKRLLCYTGTTAGNNNKRNLMHHILRYLLSPECTRWVVDFFTPSPMSTPKKNCDNDCSE